MVVTLIQCSSRSCFSRSFCLWCVRLRRAFSWCAACVGAAWKSSAGPSRSPWCCCGWRPGESTFSLLRRHFSAWDRKSTRLNSSHLGISDAVFCLKIKNEHARILVPRHAPKRLAHLWVAAETLGAVDQPQIQLVLQRPHVVFF